MEEETTSGTVTYREVIKAAEPLGTKELYGRCTDIILTIATIFFIEF